MKHQYFGDIGDYKKFSLLKHLSAVYSIMVCWMLTDNDSSNDGRFIHYLRDPQKWRKYDDNIFDLMEKSVLQKGIRNLEIFENSNIIPNQRFFSRTLHDELDAREDYIEEMLKNCIGVNLIFLDPDNGIEIESVKYGGKGSKKYVFWKEIKKIYNIGIDLLVYQHFPRQNRENYTRNLSLKILNELKTDMVLSIRVRHAVFFMTTKKEMRNEVMNVMQLYKNNWKEHIYIDVHHKNTKVSIEDNSHPITNSQLSLF